MADPDEPFPGYAACAAMPEVAEKTIGEMAAGTMGLGLTCRDCGREAAFTPLGIRTQLLRYRAAPVVAFAKACRCQTCDGTNVIAHGAPLEPREHARPYILYRERRGGPRLDRP
jgi:hypothetical protein